jgi:hypothetical protein
MTDGDRGGRGSGGGLRSDRWGQSGQSHRGKKTHRAESHGHEEEVADALTLWQGGGPISKALSRTEFTVKHLQLNENIILGIFWVFVTYTGHGLQSY